MSFVRFGSLLIGCVLLFWGFGIVASGIDPLDLCFKQCDIPKLFVAIFGPAISRLLAGAVFVIIGVLFVVLPFSSSRGQKEMP